LKRRRKVKEHTSLMSYMSFSSFLFSMIKIVPSQNLLDLNDHNMVEKPQIIIFFSSVSQLDDKFAISPWLPGKKKNLMKKSLSLSEKPFPFFFTT